jgi:hypothetical protein
LLPDRVTSIDETNRGDHRYLEAGDRCFFFGEYFARKGYQGGRTNQLILNFKCKPTVAAANAARRSHKERAIQTIASGLRKVIARESAEQITWIPIPPSKAGDDADYDDRLLRTLNTAFGGYHVDVRTVLRQGASTAADHDSSGDRITPEALYALMQVDEQALNSKPLHPDVFLFDDVLTTGKHFKCCERRLREVLPAQSRISGLFVARRLLTDPMGDIAAIE